MIPVEKSKMLSFASSVLKNIVTLLSFRFLLKKLVVLLLDQHLVFALFLHLLQLTYSILRNRDNLVKTQLCIHYFDQLQFIE